MSGPWEVLDRLLRVDPADVGCDRAMVALAAYAELLEQGADVDTRAPGVAAHLRACGPCAQDLTGLLAALHADRE